jgi:hypothetical protein
MKTPVEQMIEFVTSEEFDYNSKTMRNEWFKLFLEREKDLIVKSHYDGYNADYQSEEPKKSLTEYAIEYYEKLKRA